MTRISEPDRQKGEAMKKKNGKRESIILRVVLLAFSIYVIYLLGANYTELVSVTGQRQQLEAEKADLEKKVKEYNNLLENGTEKDFIERAARDKLGFVYPDEQVFVDISGN